MEQTIINGNPWKGLSSYTYQDADRFYGRDQELKDIASVIKQNAFTTLYGISGAGKTSIINAGLFPLLDKQAFLPIYIRLDHNGGHVPYDMQIIKAVENALTSINAESEDIVGHTIDSELDKLWLYFHSRKFWSKDNHIINPIIFIDQFEEIFTKNDDVDNIWAFFNIIDSLQYSTPTERILRAMENSDQFVSFGEEQNFRMVFSMREDFLARLEDYSYNIPALRKNRIGLKPLNGQQALEVILRPRPEMVTRKVALHIISKVVGKPISDNERKLEATSVDTSILSLFCTELYNYAMSDNKGEISIPLVDLYGGNILEWFYDRNMQILPKQTYVYLENQLLTHSGFRNSVALENLLENGVLQEQLDLLAENRIIRIEDVNHNLRVEFTHDVLCKIAKKRKDERDAIEKMKGEKAARRAFTIDNAILFSAFSSVLLASYYAGQDSAILLIWFSLPFIAFLYMIIVNRTVADKNLSNTIWFIITGIAIEGGLAAGWRSNLDSLNINEGSPNLYGPIAASILSFIPIGILLMPFAILCKKELSKKYQYFKSMKHSAYVYLAFLLVQSILLGCFTYIVNKEEYDSSATAMLLILFLFPSILLALSPLYVLWKDSKNKSSKLLSGYSSAYTLFILLFAIMLWVHSKYHVLPSGNSDAFVYAFVVIWGAIGILSIFYAIQYVKQPKKQSFTDYYKNVLSFQAFIKYKSFKTRLYTILICFAIFLMGVIATKYIDVVPFVALPIACLLSVHAGCSEFKLTTPKTSFSLKLIVPIIILSEIIVGVQYVIGKFKLYLIILAAISITIWVLYHLLHKEVLQNRKLFALRVSAFAVFVGFLLPLICLGYNIFNISLNSVSRVWNGAISSDARNIYFMTIQDEEGNFGVMDYSEIIVEPKYKRIASTFSINTNIVESVYPLRYTLMEIFKVRYRGSGYAAYSYAYEKQSEDYEKLLSFDVMTADGRNETLNGLHFLGFKNKYGISYVNSWLKNYQGYAMPFLSYDNKCISEKDRKATMVKLFIKELANTCKNMEDLDNYRFYDGIGKIRVWDSDGDVMKLLIRCYNEATLEPLLKKNEKSPFTIEQLEQAALNASYLFVSDRSGELEDAILNRLWNKVNQEDGHSNGISNENRSYLYLLSGNKAKAEQNAKASMTAYPNSLNASCNLCLSLYFGGKLSEMDEELIKFGKTNLNTTDSIVAYYNNISSKIAHMTDLGILKKDNELLSHVVSVFKWDDSNINKQRIALEESGDALNAMAYEFARDAKYSLAMMCIEKAIRLYPKEANYYDSKGEILLMQGNSQDALNMWKKVIDIDSDFLDSHNSVLHRQLLELDLLSD